MSRPVVTVPYALMRMTQVDWWIDWRGQGSERNDGNTKTVYNRAPIWRGQFSLALPGAFAGEWRATHWAAEGRRGLYRLYMVDPILFDRNATLAAAFVNAGIPFSDGATFGDGTGYEPGPLALADAGAAPGASSIVVEIPDPALVPVRGQILSADDWPMGVISVEALGGIRYRIGVRMQRATIAAGDPIALVGTGLFEAEEDDASRMSYGLGRIARPEVTLREALNR
ncbi:hypothetical protein [Marinibacterium profundimaris]|uniref:Uncharacterized protein n=1 Tax=Marinibacterium profundimaris TaxID=1679460 RepID=A0A225NWH4_9RHOB|nr:hypothetical protein [Marinibacterium profundimaris]OWU77598.1 hypothetical protein ATO3_02615 [Marinibacterium profundimaris]